jgi:hypothetical protein
MTMVLLILITEKFEKLLLWILSYLKRDKPMDNSTHRTGYVAFLDVLGFSEMVASDGFNDLFESYIGIIRDATNLPEKPLEYEISSDSIVIYTDETGLCYLENLLSAVATISFRFLTEIDIPIRGAVSAGKYWRLESKDGVDSMFAGPPIVDAVRYEKEQDWIGVLVTPKILELTPELRNLHSIPKNINAENLKCFKDRFPWPLLIWRQERIPFHDKGTSSERYFSGIVVVPRLAQSEDPNELLDNLKACVAKLQELKLLAPNPETQQKYNASRICLEEIRKKWERVTSQRCWIDQE